MAFRLVPDEDEMGLKPFYEHLVEAVMLDSHPTQLELAHNVQKTGGDDLRLEAALVRPYGRQVMTLAPGGGSSVSDAGSDEESFMRGAEMVMMMASDGAPLEHICMRTGVYTAVRYEVDGGVVYVFGKSYGLTLASSGRDGDLTVSGPRIRVVEE